MTDDPDLKKMLELSAASDLKSALKAKEDARRRMHEDATAANIAAYERAAAMLERIQAGLAPADAPPQATPQPDPGQSKRLAKISEVVKYLKDEGYKIAKSKIYNDVKAGYLTPADDGSFQYDSVIAYIHTQMLDKIADNRGDKIDQLTEKRLQKEVEKLTAQVEKLQFDLQRDRGKYLPKDEVRTELALKIATFEAALKHLYRTHADEWISLTEGNLKYHAQFIEILYGHLDNLLDEMSQCEELDLVVGKN